MKLPPHLIYPMAVFAESFHRHAAEGAARMAAAKIAFVGLARDCGPRLVDNLKRLEQMVAGCRDWALHIEANDCTDNTEAVLAEFCGKYHQASYRYRTLGRKARSSEFAGPRTMALAEYRTACQDVVRNMADAPDYVVMVDWDQWGGWSPAGFANGIGWLVELQGAYGMASVSLAQHPMLFLTNKESAEMRPSWTHYDAWTLRINSFWDDYTAGEGGWKHQWIPPVGSDPIRMCSAFGGLAIYRTEDYLQGVYDGRTDCEHVKLDESIQKATGKHLYLNPSMRCVMGWITEDDNARHGQHGVQDAAGGAA